jgi:putative inorganic carbon (hco3(-)) transporter
MILFYILVLTAPMPNHPLFEASFAGLTVVKWLGFICCAYAFHGLSRRPKLPAFLKSWQARFFVVLFGIATLSSLTLSKTEALPFSPMFTYVSYVLLFFTTISLVDTYERLRRTLLAMIAGAGMASLYVIREFQLSGGANARPGYITGDSNYFAACTLLVIPMAVYFVKMKSSRLQRWFCGASLLVMLAAFTLASSRGGLVGLSAVVIYMIVRSGQSRRAAIVMTLLLVPMLLYAPASPLSRMLHPTYGDYIGAQVRREFWDGGMNMISSHPMTGIGLGNFTAQSSSKALEGFHGIACNTFLEVAAELGIPGLVAYCVILGGALWSAGKLRAEGQRRNDTFLQYAGQALQAGLVGFSVAAVFLSVEYQKPFWVMVALTSAVPTLLRDHSDQPVHPAEQARAASAPSFGTGDEGSKTGSGWSRVAARTSGSARSIHT